MPGYRHFGLIPGSVRRKPVRTPRLFDDMGWLLILLVIYLVSIVWLIILAATPSRSQPQSHELHHAQYQDWQSNAGFACCNNRDCGELPDKDVRDAGDHREVRVDDQWCPIKEEHLLSVGKSPDWSRNHACISSSASGQSPCERFKCFKGKAEL